MKVTLRMSVSDEEVLSGIFFEGRNCIDSRICNYMIGNSFNKWIAPFSDRHIIWKGFLSELSDLLNTRTFIIEFDGTLNSYEKFKDLVLRTTAQKFNLSFELKEINIADVDINFDSINKLISLMKNKKSLLAKQFKTLFKLDDKIYLQVIYENYGESKFFQWLPDYPIDINRISKFEISMPVIFVSEKDFYEDPHEICRNHQVEPSNVMIIAVNANKKEVAKKISQIKTNFPDIQVFSLTGNEEEDKQELLRMKNFYLPYVKDKLREFVSNFSEEDWTDSQMVDTIIKNF